MSKRTISEHLRRRIAAKVESGEIETPDVIERIRSSQPDQERLPIELDDELDDEVEGEFVEDDIFEPTEEDDGPTDVMEAFNALVEEREVFVALQDAHQEGYTDLLEGADRNPYNKDDLRHTPWAEGFQDAVSEAEVVRVVIAAMGLIESETPEDTDGAFAELEASVKELSDVETLIEFWEKVTSDG